MFQYYHNKMSFIYKLFYTDESTKDVSSDDNKDVLDDSDLNNDYNNDYSNTQTIESINNNKYTIDCEIFPNPDAIMIPPLVAYNMDYFDNPK